MVHLKNGNIFVCHPQSPCSKSACSKAVFPLSGFSEECVSVGASLFFQKQPGLSVNLMANCSSSSLDKGLGQRAPQ
jgi:hypothetical protein